MEKKKKVKIILLTTFLVLFTITSCLALFYAVLHINVPLENPVELGSDNIVIPTSITEQDENLSVMSFNVKCFTLEENEERYWTNRKDDVLKLILDYNPDIIGFQEVTHPQYKYLIENLGDKYGYYGCYRSGLNIQRGNNLIKSTDPNLNIFTHIAATIIDEATPIFYKKSRFELADYKTFWLSENPDKPTKGWGAKHKRICSHVELKDHYTNNTINFLSTHFDNKSDDARLESAKLINNYIKDTESAILVGDFNAIEYSEPYNELISESLVNTKYMLPENERSSGPTGNGYGKFNKDVPIDHIFVQQAQYDTLSNIIIDERTIEGHFISDHFPVLATLTYK